MRTIGQVFALTGAVSAASALLPASAWAHPHVLIEGRSTVLFDDAGLIKGLKIEWQFDEMYSAWAIDGLDQNKSGTYEPEELAPLGADNVVNLKEYSYFTYASAKDGALEFAEVTDYGITFDGAQLTLTMILPFKVPLDPKADAFSFQIYDPSFWIYIGMRKANGLGFEGKAPEGCGFQIKEPATDGSQAYVPDDLAVRPENANLGAQFAETVMVTCTGGSAQTEAGTAG